MPDDDSIITGIEAIIQDDEPLDAHGFLTGFESARENAEKELIELTRGDNAEGFQLTVMFRNGIFTVLMVDLVSGTCEIGDGRSFTEAWHKRAKPGLAPETRRNPPLLTVVQDEEED
ncbi:hypothetical protein BH10PSE7_BH10PSE7_37540 [soil metagenome]